MTTPIRIGDLLKDKKLIDDRHIGYALKVQSVTKEKMGQVLTRVGLVSEYDLAHTLAEQLKLEHINLNIIEPDMGILKLFKRNNCLNNRIFPIRTQDNSLLVATSDLPDTRLEQEVMRTSGMQPTFAIAEESKLVSAVYNYFFFLDNPVEEMLKKEMETLAADASLTVPPDNFVYYLLLLAVKNRATDIHIRPMERGISILFRVDGVLSTLLHMPPELHRVISAIKLQAGMDISEQRLPQDGRWTVNLLERKYDIRVSSVVTPYGENLVLRLLSQERVGFSLASLGFLDEDLEKIYRAFDEPFGIVLLTGPTGSGKSTTLVAGLLALDLLGKNVLTIENPIEYIVPLVRQTQINTPAGYDFSNAMPYFMRHDPDVILIGEMRDEKTARTAMTAATTGHLVLSTLHSNTSLGAIPRLRILGIDNLTLAESMICVISQRLLRTICPKCKTPYEASEEDAAYLGKEVKQLYFGSGCDFCKDSGYYGRTLVYEVLLLDKELRSLMEQGGELGELERMAREKGFRSMFQVGVHKVLEGITTVEELRRVLGRLRF